jgi:4-hydroxy-2-oxoheptanedioate aldolase
MAGLRERIRSGEVLIGSLHDFTDPHLIELVAYCGVDFLVLCYEHGLKDERQVAEMIRAADSAHVPVLIRVGRRESDNLERFLDAGAAGFLVSHVTDSERAAAIVSWCKYPPLGGRGAGFTRGWLAQLGENELERKMRANDEVVIIGIVEDPEGVDNIDEILGVPGIDGIIAGPGDLALAMGEATHEAPRVQEAVQRINEAVRRSDRHALMSFCSGPERVGLLLSRGSTLLLMNHDTHIIRDAYRRFLGEAASAIAADRHGS